MFQRFLTTSRTVVTLVAAVCFVLVACRAAEAKLVGHWKFDGDFTDEVNGNHGVGYLSTTAGTNNGIVGGAAIFNGDDFAVDIDGLDDLIGSTVSISFWEFTSATDDNYFFSTGDPPNGSGHFFARRDGVDRDNFNAVVAFPAANTTSFGPFDRNVWNHHLLVADASGPGIELEWYVNGNLEGTASDSPNAFSDIIQNVFTVGNRQARDRGFRGLIDDLQVYDNRWGLSQAQFLFNNPGSIVPEPSTFALAGFALLGITIAVRRRRR